MHKRAERDGTLAEEPEVVLGPVIGIGIERAKDPVTKRQCHSVGSIVLAQSVQISDRLRAQHLVIVQEHDAVVPALRQREATCLLHRRRPGYRDHPVGVAPCDPRRAIGG
jgi:hypothetical protein